MTSCVPGPATTGSKEPKPLLKLVTPGPENSAVPPTTKTSVKQLVPELWSKVPLASSSPPISSNV